MPRKVDLLIGVGQYAEDSGLHPSEVEGDTCVDFELDLEIPDDEATAWYGEQWQPEGASYSGES